MNYYQAFCTILIDMLNKIERIFKLNNDVNIMTEKSPDIATFLNV